MHPHSDFQLDLRVPQCRSSSLVSRRTACEMYAHPQLAASGCESNALTITPPGHTLREISTTTVTWMSANFLVTRGPLAGSINGSITSRILQHHLWYNWCTYFTRHPTNNAKHYRKSVITTSVQRWNEITLTQYKHEVSYRNVAPNDDRVDQNSQL